MRPLIAADCDAAEAKAGLPDIVSLLCSYVWIRVRGATFGRRGVFESLATTLTFYSGKVGTEGKQDLAAYSRCGALCALETIADALKRIGFHTCSSTEPCNTRGERDSGLAGELYGRAAVLKFEHIAIGDGAARRDAL